MSGIMFRAFLEAGLIGALAGLVGIWVVVQRRAFFATALTHATFPGAALALVLGFSHWLGALVFSLVLVAVLIWLNRSTSHSAAAITGVIMSGGFALGALLSAAFPANPISLESLLTGSILTVSDTDLTVALLTLILVIVIMLLFKNSLMSFSFDPTGYARAGRSAVLAEVVSLGLVAVTVVALMPAVGAILAIALLVAPAAAAKLLSNQISTMFWLAPLLGIASACLGLFISYKLAISAGATIAITAALVFLAAWSFQTLSIKLRKIDSSLAI